MKYSPTFDVNVYQSLRLIWRSVRFLSITPVNSTDLQRSLRRIRNRHSPKCMPCWCILVYNYKNVFHCWWYRWPRSTASSCFYLLNLAAFIVLKVSKRMTSADIVQKVQSFLICFMFRVLLQKFFILFIYYVTSLVSFVDSMTGIWLSVITGHVATILDIFLDCVNKYGE